MNAYGEWGKTDMAEKNKDGIREENRREKTLRVLAYFLIVAFFITVVFVFYRKLYSETKDNIINTGRLNAVESANQIDRRMSASMDTMKLAAYTVDNMIRDGHSQEEILEYLTNETVAVADSLIADTTGVYGYVRGEYMDGSGWDPGADYVPTERPWYIEAKAGSGRLVIVDPYLDMDTGTIMITITKMLCDAKSVIGIDLSMNALQTIVENHASKGNSAAEIIVNGKGMIIAHSERNLIGTDLNDSSDPLSQAITEMIRGYENGYRNVRKDNLDYIVYVLPLENEWTYVSVIDATDDFANLRGLLFSTVMISLIIISILGIFATKSEKRSREARESALQTRHAMAANEAKTAFLSNMSHEIRTPINTILGMNEMILREEHDDTILGYAESIRSAGGSLLGIINDVLDFSKIEAGKIEIIPVEYDISSVISDLVNMVHKRADEKGLTLNLKFDSDIPKILYGDEVRIKQVISNILTNAVKYTEKGSITFSISGDKIADDPDNVMLCVSVEDTGIGIRQADIRRLFSKFERIEETRNRNIEGTGLGMNITKSLLELMGSSLEVESVYGEGSKFSFRLKQKVVRWEPLGDYRASYREHVRNRRRYEEKFVAPGARILVVDDNPMNLMVFQSLIKQTMIKTDTAERGDEGISLTRSEKYDILFLDHMMPEKDGIETLHEIRSDEGNPNKNTPAVCLTANAISGAREKYINAGFDDYLTKPVDTDKLEKVLLAILPKDLIIEKQVQEGDALALDGPAPSVPEEIEALDGDLIEVEQGMKNSSGYEVYRSVLKVFHASADEQKKELDRYCEEGDVKNYTIRVHALKSSAKLIGATGLAVKAQMLENAGKRGDIDYIREHHGPFAELHMMIKDLLSGIFDKEVEEKIELPAADREIMDKAYDGIGNAASAMDCERLENIFEQMQEYSIPESDRDLFEKLRAASDKYDYDLITELLENERKN